MAARPRLAFVDRRREPPHQLEVKVALEHAQREAARVAVVRVRANEANLAALEHVVQDSDLRTEFLRRYSLVHRYANF